jgi:hypothetical protein
LNLSISLFSFFIEIKNSLVKNLFKWCGNSTMKKLNNQNKLHYQSHHCQKVIDDNSKDPKIKKSVICKRFPKMESLVLWSNKKPIDVLCAKPVEPTIYKFFHPFSLLYNSFLLKKTGRKCDSTNNTTKNLNDARTKRFL